ncbi:putative fructan beta-(2,1)-fructosidase [Helianthus annuus]|uniref:Putative glycoside hydrolase, family 32 n=1 Tax=Helianthus annuus TaxID=4232 RepID=A0A251RQL7_HELAN|nr:putative fructan beta-(2,1)-fructosidase [Helianthus annuus]KAJ0936661.1 putative fructan beta-(2,1)-fructosidase [Helianthus annuus]
MLFKTKLSSLNIPIKIYGFYVFSLCCFLIFNGVHVEAFRNHTRLLNVSQPYRTAYHFQPTKNWMNGPMYYKGVYHFFYQHNPYGPLWGNMSWGHAISHDLINWVHLDIALVPNEHYDINGCFSGSATILPNGEPAILYTGVDAKLHQVQNLAFPKNISDPLLKEWVKWPLNPILSPPDEIDPSFYRDPSTGWMGADGEWRVVIGSRIDHQGAAILYKSKDFRSWNRSLSPFPLSNITTFWECPEFYPVISNGKSGLDTSVISVQGKDIKHVLKASFNDQDYYILGKYDPESDRYDVYADFMKSKEWLQYDYGKFYASKSFYDGEKKRRILWSWVSESDTAPDAIEKGWSGLQTIPRSIWLSKNEDQLVQWPVKELEKLRTRKVHFKNKRLKGRSMIEISGITASQADVEITFRVSNLKHAEVLSSEVVDPQILCTQKNATTDGKFGPFGLLVLASKNLTEHTAVFFRVFRIANSFRVLMCADPSRSSLKPFIDKPIYGAFLALDPRYAKISLRTLIDHSIVESFGGEGLACITSRVYPVLAVGEQAHLYAFNNGTKSLSISSLSAWSMKKAQIV